MFQYIKITGLGSEKLTVNDIGGGYSSQNDIKQESYFS